MGGNDHRDGRFVFASSVEIYGKNRGDAERLMNSIAAISIRIRFVLATQRPSVWAKLFAKLIPNSMELILVIPA